MPGGLRGASVVLAAIVAIGAVVPVRARAGPCPADMPGGCKGFLSGKHLALATVLGTGLDAMPILAVAVTADGKMGYGLRADGALDAWDLATGSLRRVAIARFIALDPRGRWAIAPQARKGLPDRDWRERGSGLEIWDLTTRRRVAAAKVEWEDPLHFVFSRRVFVWGFLDGDYGSWIWDAATGKVRKRGFGFCDFAAVTPDGRRALCTGGVSGGDADGDDDEDAASDDGVALWDLDRLKIARRMPRRALRDGRVAGLAVSPDGGKALAILSQGRGMPRTSVIWNLATGQTSKGPEVGDWSGPTVRWSPDARRVISIGGDRDRGVALSPADKGKPIWLGDGREGVTDAVFLPDGKRILTGDGKGVMRLASVADGRTLRASREMTGHHGEVLSLSISRDGKRLLSCGKDHTARLWDLDGNRPLRSIPLDPHDNPVALMTPDGAFAIASLTGLTLLELPDGKPRQVLVADRNASPLAVSPDGTMVLVRTAFGTKLWEIPSGREIWSQNELGGAAAFSPDQRWIYSGLSYRTVMSVIDAGSGVVKTSFGRAGATGQSPTSALALAPHEDFFIMHGGIDDRAFWGPGGHDLVGRFDIPSGRFVWTIMSRHYVRQLALSPDGRWFVATGSLHWGGDKDDPMKRFPSRVELHATTDGSVVDALDLDSAELVPFSAAFTPDGRTLLVGTEDGPILRFAVMP